KDDITEAGYCDVTTHDAVWCDPQTGEIFRWKCAAEGLSCSDQNDCFRWDDPTQKVQGAYCCDPNTKQSKPPVGQSCTPETVPYQCAADRTSVIYCENGTVQVDRCMPGEACQIFSASPGKVSCSTRP